MVELNSKYQCVLVYDRLTNLGHLDGDRDGSVVGFRDGCFEGWLDGLSVGSPKIVSVKFI